LKDQKLRGKYAAKIWSDSDLAAAIFFDLKK